MGTRHLTVFNDEDGKEICVMVGGWDGHPRDHGQKLADLIKGRDLVNGFDNIKTQINRMNGLVAMVIAWVQNKGEICDFSIELAGSRNFEEQFIYTLYQKDWKVCLKLTDGSNNLILDGRMDDFFPGEIVVMVISR